MIPLVDPAETRRFALDIVQRLRGAGYEALWAGGCVRDQLLGREPKDYDVATSARPDEVREVFGKRHTIPVGAAFGVITVLGRHGAGAVEVATFRRDATYSDGRHPDSVTFSSAAEDAQRRDFTINGMFYDPLEQKVLDFVGGEAELLVGRDGAGGDAGDRAQRRRLEGRTGDTRRPASGPAVARRVDRGPPASTSTRPATSARTPMLAHARPQ